MIKSVLKILMTVSVSYLCFAFIEMEWNPSLWPIIARFIYIVVTGLSIWFVVTEPRRK